MGYPASASWHHGRSTRRTRRRRRPAWWAGCSPTPSIDDLETRVEVNRGGPGNPLSDEELARKFHDNAVRSLPEERAAEIAARTLALPDAQSVEDLTALLTSAGEP